MIIIENFLPEGYCDDIAKTVLSKEFPWFFIRESVHVNMSDFESRVLFSHRFKVNGEPTSSFAPFIEPIKYHIEAALKERLVIKRGKINLTIPVNQGVKGAETPHIDDNCLPDYVAIFYPIDSDGDTIIYEERGLDTPEKFSPIMNITPKRNKIVIIPGDQWHSSNTPIKSEQRLSLNLILDIEND